MLDFHIEWLQDAEKQQNHDAALRDKSMDMRQQKLSGLEHSISKERHTDLAGRESLTCNGPFRSSATDVDKTCCTNPM